MSEKEKGASAFPYTYTRGDSVRGFTTTVIPGMDLRDYFAGQALVGILSCYGVGDENAKDAYVIADAMLAERKEQNVN